MNIEEAKKVYQTAKKIKEDGHVRKYNNIMSEITKQIISLCTKVDLYNADELTINHLKLDGFTVTESSYDRDVKHTISGWENNE